MKIYGLVLISLSLGTFCNGFHIVAKVNDAPVDLELFGSSVTADLIKTMFDHNSKVSLERVEESKLKPCDPVEQVEKSTSGYRWMKYDSKRPIPRKAFQFWAMDRKLFYVGRANSPNYNKKVSVTIIFDVYNHTVYYDHSDIDESTVEILVADKYLQWVNLGDKNERSLLNHFPLEMRKNSVKLITNFVADTKGSFVCRPIVTMRGYREFYHKHNQNEIPFNVGQTGLKGNNDVCDQILPSGQTKSFDQYEILVVP